MGLCSKLFHDPDDNSVSLHDRISVDETHLQDAIESRDEVIDHIKSDVGAKLGYQIRHWIQGSYKNHTLVRPTHKGGDFDLDVGIYIMVNAENKGISAADAKSLLHQSLHEYCATQSELILDDSKNKCERVSYPNRYHLDFPLYYFDVETQTCKLATEEDGWIASDPKALQDWFNNEVGGLTDTQLARLRRVLRYLKTWTDLKWHDKDGALPSVALTVLVAYQYEDADSDDDALILTVKDIKTYFDANDTVPNPIDGTDLLDVDAQQLEVIKEEISHLEKTVVHAEQSGNVLELYLTWTAAFEHMLPPADASQSIVEENVNLPAITTPPSIRIRHIDKNKRLIGNEVKTSVHACKNESLYFSVNNLDLYDSDATVLWTARNQGTDASNLNDLGHKSTQPINEERYELCVYNGKHYMDCIVLDNGNVVGFASIPVVIAGYERPLRNPPKKAYYRRKF